MESDEFTGPDDWVWPAQQISSEYNLDAGETYLDSMLYDGTSFIIVLSQFSESLDNYIGQLVFKCPADGAAPTTARWVFDALSSENLTRQLPQLTRARALRGKFQLGRDPSVTLFFSNQGQNAPTVTSPTVSSVRIYQYVPMTPVQFSAVGQPGEDIIFFTQTSELPLGLTFNTTTNTLEGIPMTVGSTTITVFAKPRASGDDEGQAGLAAAEIRFTIEVIVPSVVRQQTSAGAWTSLTRQFTIVNAAQNSVNGKTLPATQPLLGEFIRATPPPDSVSATGDPNCAARC
jgi:hypothetical protein